MTKAFPAASFVSSGSAGISNWSGRKVLVLSPTPTHPLDFGNRRRVYQICRGIKDRGAEIHFLHYPAEDGWRSRLPETEQRAMQQEWDGYYVAPVTRPLHDDPKEFNHTIDEWWDPAIGNTLAWLFAVNNFDVFIVNYIWLSKAFEFAPCNTLKILDTHDKLAGRRELLAAHGIPREFFHLSESDEAIGANRADIVWAIKQEEEQYFRNLTAKPVLTMLHAEPVRFSPSRAKREVIRFGIVGAKNNTNVCNIRAFLRVANATIRRTLLPCEIVIAGSVCDSLIDEGSAGVTIIGRVADMKEFYDSVDVVLVPMEFSTGLKIKVAEAMAQSKPLIAHMHAFEGYVPTHRFHQLPSFEAMMAACREVVNDPNLIEDLVQASVTSAVKANGEVARALEATLDGARSFVRSMCFVLPLSDLNLQSVILDHVLEAAEYVAHRCEVLFYVDGDGGAVANTTAVQSLQRFGQVVLSPKAVRALGTRVEEVMATLRPVIRTVAELLDEDHYGFWFAHLPAELSAYRKRGRVAIVPIGALVLTGYCLQAARRTLTERFEKIYVFDYHAGQVLAEFARGAAGAWHVPLLWRGHLSGAMKVLNTTNRRAIVVTADGEDCPLVQLVIDIITAQSAAPIHVVYPTVGVKKSGRLTTVPARDYVAHVAVTGVGPCLLVDVAVGDGFTALREVLGRAHVPQLKLFDESARDLRLHQRVPSRAAGLAASVLRLTDVLAFDREFPADFFPLPHSLANDAGWAMIWQLVAELKTEFAQAA
jgi:glycosyltransferase involved in cell wall biosynthesis